MPPLDKFYTRPEVVKYLLSKIDLSTIDLCVEPSAGSGSFSLYLSQILNTLSYDIKPEHPSIKKCDFLKTDISKDLHSSHKVAVIGNPPFGKQASLACKFFNKSASYHNVEIIAMIFPKSFKKVSIQNRLDLSFHCIFQEDLADNSFVLENVVHDVPCVFQIWKRTGIDREKVYPSPLKDDLTFVKHPISSDTAIRRVGFYAGKTEFYTNQSLQSHYFVRGLSEQDRECLNSIRWEHNDTVGPRSISKYQLIPILNSL